MCWYCPDSIPICAAILWRLWPTGWRPLVRPTPTACRCVRIRVLRPDLIWTATVGWESRPPPPARVGRWCGGGGGAGRVWGGGGGGGGAGPRAAWVGGGGGGGGGRPSLPPKTRGSPR